MAAERWLASRNRTGIERSALVAVGAGEFRGRWQCAPGTNDDQVRVSVLVEISYDNGSTWQAVSGPTVFAGNAPARGATSAPIEFTARADGYLRLSVDVSGSWRFGIDVLT